MKGIAEVQIILSAIFAFIGSFALFISFLICGHNVFRDMPFRVSATMAGFLGFWLFMFSPVSFIILFPALFLEEPTIPLSSMELKFVVEFIHSLVREAMWSFILSAIGAGVLIGALSEFKPRKSILKYINKRFGLQLRVFSYEFAWDDFLRGIKRLGTINLSLKDKQVTGQLQNYSVIAEPKQLILNRCQITRRKGDPPEPVDNLLVTEMSEIKQITAPNSSLKKHHHDLNHCSQTTYLLLASIGSSMLAGSSILTIRFFKFHHQDYLIYLYGLAALAFSMLTVLFLIFAATALKHDFESYSATAVFYPLLTFFFSVMAPASYWLVLQSIGITCDIQETMAIFQRSTWFVAVLSVALSWLSLHQNKRISRKLVQLVRVSGGKPGLLKEVVEQLYLSWDFNDSSTNMKQLTPVVVENIHHWTHNAKNEIYVIVDAVLRAIDALADESGYLRKEEANIVMKWHNLLKRNHLIGRGDSERAEG